VSARFTRMLTFLVLLCLAATSVLAQDAREAARKAAAEREAARRAAAEAEARILEDRERLTSEVKRLEAQERALKSSLDSLSTRIQALHKEDAQLGARWGAKEQDFREIQGNIRYVARELEALLLQSLTSADAPERLETLAPILQERYFPDIEDVSTIATLLLDQAERSGEVAVRDGPFKGRDGTDQTGTVLRLGTFTAMYRTPNETGFLEYSTTDHDLEQHERPFSALAALPPRRVRGQINRYLDGGSDDAPIDFSGGLALQQLTQGISVVEQLRAGGPLVYPIGFIALLALVIIVERAIYLHRVYGNTDRVMGEVNELASRGDWDAAEKFVHATTHARTPVIRVLQAGLAGRREHRETLESLLQEAILRELPKLERFLSVLSVLGTVAPLLGLLGTVTGMIGTFHVITLHGTGNPRIMSGGISEALVTTELGLAVAIPIMLLHVVLSRRVSYLVGDMEEKAIALTNIIHKERVRHDPNMAAD